MNVLAYVDKVDFHQEIYIRESTSPRRQFLEKATIYSSRMQANLIRQLMSFFAKNERNFWLVELLFLYF